MNNESFTISMADFIAACEKQRAADHSLNFLRGRAPNFGIHFTKNVRSD